MLNKMMGWMRLHQFNMQVNEIVDDAIQWRDLDCLIISIVNGISV